MWALGRKPTFQGGRISDISFFHSGSCQKLQLGQRAYFPAKARHWESRQVHWSMTAKHIMCVSPHSCHWSQSVGSDICRPSWWHRQLLSM